MSFLLLEHRKILFSAISEAVAESGFSEYSMGLLRFCKSWIDGQVSFEITTSGSTGQPQKISLSRELMLWSIGNTAQALHLKSNMHCLLCLDVAKAGGMMMLARALHLQMSVEVVPPAADPFKGTISNHFDFAAMVPMQLYELAAKHRFNELNNIDVLIIGGASLSSLLVKELQQLPTRVYATYGMTETASHIALQRMNGKNREDTFVLLPEVQLSLDENNRAVISTPFHQTLHTRDIVEMLSNHSFVVKGRSDNRINSGGVKFQMETIEEAVEKALTACKLHFFNFCAYWQHSNKLGEQLILIFETEEGTFDQEAFLKELSNHLHKYEMPKQIYFTDKLVYTTSGKINRRLSAEKLGI